MVRNSVYYHRLPIETCRVIIGSLVLKGGILYFHHTDLKVNINFVLFFTQGHSGGSRGGIGGVVKKIDLK